MNAAHLELVKLDRKWYAACKAAPQNVLFVFQGKKHDMKLVETYFKSQHAEDTRTEDKFLILFHEFENQKTYASQQLSQWNDLYQKYHESEKTGVTGDIPVTDLPENATDAHKIVDAIIFLNHQNQVPKDICTFVLLMPYQLQLSARKGIQLWIDDFCDAVKTRGLQQKIKLALQQYKGQEYYKSLPSHQLIDVEMDINALMSDLASESSQKNASTEFDFQQQVLLANNYLTKNNNAQARVAVEKAIRLSKINQNIEWECIARLLSVFTSLNEKEKEKAFSEFANIIHIAGDNSVLSVQMHMSYASFLFASSKSSKAREVLEEAANIASSSQLKELEVECYRILGDVTSKSQYYEKCIEVSSSMTAQQAQGSSLAYVAYKLTKQYGKDTVKAQKLDEKLLPLLGENWYINAEKQQKT